MYLKEAVVILTGASQGIGAMTAQALGKEGCRVVLAARTEASLATVATQVRQAGGEALIIPTDMGDINQVKNLAQRTLDRYGRVDALINNAGYGQFGPLSELTEAQIRQQFEVNVFGLLFLSQAVIPAMRAQRKGRIINVSSVAGVFTLPFEGLYHASKYAVEALSDALRMELAPFGLYVSVIQPGPVKTNFFNQVRAKSDENYGDGSPYAQLLPQVEVQLQRFIAQGTTPEAISTAILRALTDQPPQARYVVFPGGSLMLNLVQNLPDALRDRFFMEWYGLDQPL